MVSSCILKVNIISTVNYVLNKNFKIQTQEQIQTVLQSYVFFLKAFYQENQKNRGLEISLFFCFLNYSFCIVLKFKKKLS